MRCFTLIFMIFLISLLSEVNVFSQEKTRITKVVIDAGHGGKDPGTIGKKSQEKNVALQIALKLSEEIRSKCTGVTVICTRTTDEFIELHERAEIANRSKADLFISIHCNANPKHTFLGAETYVMGLHRTEANLEIAKKENAAILMEPDYSTNYNGFDPNSDESYITFTLFQNAYLDQSTRFASYVQDEMKDRVGMMDRGVRQAGFLVLYKTTMPSVLVETGFLSNPEEEKFLMSEKGQQYIAAAICRAFCKFKLKMEGNGRELASLNVKKAPVSNAAVTMPVPQKPSPAEEKKPKEGSAVGIIVKSSEKPVETLIHKDTSVKPKDKLKEATRRKDTDRIQAKPKENLKEKETVKTNEKNGQKVITSQEKTSPVKKNSAAPKVNLTSNIVKPEKTNVVKPEKANVIKPGKKNAVENSEPAKRETIKSAPAKASSGVVFRVQFATSPKELSLHSKKFTGLPEVWRYLHQGSYKYTIGEESSPEALSGLLKQAREKGFSDAFIVAFHGSERITVAEAKKLLNLP